MTEQILPNELQKHPLRVADVVSYLHHSGWLTIAHPNPRLLTQVAGYRPLGVFHP